MCYCGKPTVNGDKLAYSWNGNDRSTYPVIPPELEENDFLIFDLPGRCGEVDCHHYHYRIVLKSGSLSLLVRHGAGQERINYLSNDKTLLEILRSLDDNGRFWLCNSIFQVFSRSKIESAEKERMIWKTAIAEKRIKKSRKCGYIRISIV